MARSYPAGLSLFVVPACDDGDLYEVLCLPYSAGRDVGAGHARDLRQKI